MCLSLSISDWSIVSPCVEIADNHGDAGDCHDAVITVPLHFTEKQTQAARASAEDGGFNVLRVIDETSAAVLAYDIGQVNHHEDW